MILYLVRHAFAGQRGDPKWPDDSQRPLTKEGRKRFVKVADRLVASGDFAPSIVATSPFVRCQQTAEVLSEAFEERPRIHPIDALEPGGDIDEAIRWTNEQAAEAVCWVGHAPDIEDQAAVLLDMSSGHFRMPKSAAAALTFDGPVARGAGELRWLITAKILGV